MNKVSVIIPSYNSSAYIEKTIRSVLEQTYRDIEVIVVDDASTDNTLDIVNSIDDSRIILIPMESNGGAALARNAGIDEAKGRYVAFLDSDDSWHPEKLDLQIKEMRDCKAVFCFTSYIVESEGRKILIEVPQELNYQKLLRGNVIATSTVMYDAASIGRVTMPNLRMRQDFATWLNILKQVDRGVGVNTPLMYYNNRKDSLSSKIMLATQYTYKVYRETQDLSALKSIYYLSLHLKQALKKRVKRPISIKSEGSVLF